MTAKRRPINKLAAMRDGRHRHQYAGRAKGHPCNGYTLNGRCCACGLKMVFKKK